MRAKDVLLNALLDFTGTVAFVSHDRYFIDKLATKVFAIGDGKVIVYPGNYEDYLWQAGRSAEESKQTPKDAVSDSLKAALQFTDAEQARENGAGPAASKRRMNPIQAKKLRKQVAALEDEISKIEGEIGELQESLVANSKNHQQSAAILTQMETLRATAAEREQEWTQLTEKLEA